MIQFLKYPTEFRLITSIENSKEDQAEYLPKALNFAHQLLIRNHGGDLFESEREKKRKNEEEKKERR